MVFNSLEFGFFFAIVVTAFFAVPHRWRWVLILIASYVFYMWWNASYAVLIALSTVVDFVAGRVIHSAEGKRTRKLALLTSLCTNLGLLFTFKYWTFFHETMADIAGSVAFEYAPPELRVLLPVGISLYTFQTMSYTIDIYRHMMAPEPLRTPLPRRGVGPAYSRGLEFFASLADERDGVLFEPLNEVTHPVFLRRSPLPRPRPPQRGGRSDFHPAIGETIEANFPSVAAALE